MPERVAELELTLTYPSGHVARFTGTDLLADIRLTPRDLPTIEVQDAFGFKLEAPQTRHLVVDITLDLQGKLLTHLGKEII